VRAGGVLDASLAGGLPSAGGLLDESRAGLLPGASRAGLLPDSSRAGGLPCASRAGLLRCSSRAGGFPLRDFASAGLTWTHDSRHGALAGLRYICRMSETACGGCIGSGVVPWARCFARAQARYGREFGLEFGVQLKAVIFGRGFFWRDFFGRGFVGRDFFGLVFGRDFVCVIWERASDSFGWVRRNFTG
jgi:hypothetical protein